MSVQLYDKAFVEKLNNWTKDSNITILTTSDMEELIRVAADQHNDSPISLPAIILSRPGGFTVLDTTKRALSFDGATLDANQDTACTLNAIPISIPYQIDVYTRYFSEADDYIRNLVFNIINYPKLDVNIPYHGKNYHHDANIRMESEVDNNSDIPERLFQGQFTRLTIKLNIDDAYLFDIRYRDVYQIKTDVVTSSSIVEDSKNNILV